MTVRDDEHQVAVTEWFQRTAHASPGELIQAFEDAFAALWQRSIVTLGEITLMAIVERVLHTATEQYPLLASLEVAASGFRCQSLQPQAALRPDQISAALRFVLVEFLTVLGNLTAQILTPALHEELSKCHSNTKDSGITEDEAP